MTRTNAHPDRPLWLKRFAFWPYATSWALLIINPSGVHRWVLFGFLVYANFGWSLSDWLWRVHWRRQPQTMTLNRRARAAAFAQATWPLALVLIAFDPIKNFGSDLAAVWRWVVNHCKESDNDRINDTY